jgi:predicted nucleotidyltransferase
MHHFEKQLDDLVKCIVDAVHPLRIILFGSAARGEMDKHSDVDVLVVMPEGTHRRHTAMHLYKHITGFPFAVDIIVATPDDLEKYKDTIGMVYRHILREGKEIYAA